MISLFSLLKYYVFKQDIITLVFDIVILFSVISLIVFHGIIKKKEKNYKIWRFFCLVPFVLSGIHFLFYRFSDWNLTIGCYGSIYFSAIAIAIWQFFYKSKWWYRITSVILVIYTFGSIFCSVVSNAISCPVIGNYTRKNYEKCFAGIVKEMKENYCLNDWKEIDYEFLNRTILPKVKKAQESNNEVDFCIALCEYCYYFYDGHVRIWPNTNDGQEVYKKAKEILAGNDYGFSMITLDNGETVAIMVDENSEAYKEGIRNGTVITEWNGKEILKAVDEVKCIYPRLAFPVKENEDILKPIFLAGKGEKINQIKFIDDNENEKEVNVKSLGSYDTRLRKTLQRFYHITEYKTNEEYKNDNFSCKMISDNIGYLKIISEEYNEFLDIKAVITHEYPEITDLVDSKLEDLQKQGMKKLIIDTRNNTGGFDEVGGAVASLFTDKDFFNYSFGDQKNGSYIKTDEHYMKGIGKWKNLEVVVLTNSECMSAGDGLVNYLANCDNVTIMGLTTSNGVNQNSGGICYTTNGDFYIVYPFALTLDKVGNPLIDTQADRVSRIKLDEKIRITKEAADVIFGNNNRDYELEYAIKYLCR